MSWQWGQVQQQELSVLYGRVFPPADAADRDRLPGFIGILGPDGPLGYATDVRIRETNGADGRPRQISVEGFAANFNVKMTIAVQSAILTKAGASGRLSSGLDFLQMRGDYTVTGRAAGREIKFTAPGSAETFRSALPNVQSAP